MTGTPVALRRPTGNRPDTAAAVLFDMDGLLVDSEPAWSVAEEELAARLGGRWSTRLKAEIAGSPLEQAVPRILAAYGRPVSPDEVTAATDFLLRRMTELFAGRLPLRLGARRLLTGLAAKGVPTGLVSSSRRVLMDAVLRRIGFHRFDVTVACDEVARGKPDPQPYRTACAALRVAPGDCVVLEDSMNGVRSAEAAGCVVVAVPELARIPPAPGRLVVGSLRELTVSRLLGLPAELAAGGG